MQSVPQYCYVDTDTPQMTLNFYPVPYAVFTAFVTSQRQIVSTPVTLSTTLALPPGYDSAIVDNLAVDIAPSFGMPVKPEMMLAATNARRRLKRINYIPLEMEVGMVPDGGDVSNGFFYQGWR